MTWGVLEEDKVKRTWKDYFQDLHKIDTQRQVAVHKWSSDGVKKGNYFGGKTIRRAEVNLRTERLLVRIT